MPDLVIHERILGLTEKSTSLTPMTVPDLTRKLLATRPETTPDEIHDVLEHLVDQLLLSTCRITRAGITQDVYWRTGLKTPALMGIKPMEPHIVPTTQPSQPPADTKASTLIKAIVSRGPIITLDLAQHTGIPNKNIDALLKSAVKNGSITTRSGYAPEHGRELRHWMTATQAQKWDDAGIEQMRQMFAPPEEHTGHVMSHPDAEPKRKDGDDILLNILADIRAAIGDTGQVMLGDLAQAIKTRIHDYKNDIAARDLILNNLAGTLKVQHIADIPGALDELTHAMATRAMTAQAPTGKPALLLIDSADLTEVEMLCADDDAQAMAMSSIELGHAARVLVVRIIGEATRKVEWKEAA